jgi:hypothetical protein
VFPSVTPLFKKTNCTTHFLFIYNNNNNNNPKKELAGSISKLTKLPSSSKQPNRFPAGARGEKSKIRNKNEIDE